MSLTSTTALSSVPMASSAMHTQTGNNHPQLNIQIGSYTDSTTRPKGPRNLTNPFDKATVELFGGPHIPLTNVPKTGETSLDTT